MKKLITICFLIAVTFTAKAQDGKPTKEQTIEYLKSVIIGVEGGIYRDNPSYGHHEYLKSLFDIKLEGCILKIKIKKRDIVKSEIQPEEIGKDYSREIDFSNVESFNFKLKDLSGVYKNWKNYNENLHLYFDTKKYKNNYVDGFYCKPENTEKVLKALNHLRKLCGAPEPIKFD